jgi:uncharacterized protein YecE (DUF72 family)
MIEVGCCGLPTSMKKYFETFSLVELNSSFYQYPEERTVTGWREKAPKNYEFTVKAHQEISHKSRLKAEETSFEAFEHMNQVCNTLNSKILLIQTPASFKPDKLADAQGFFRKVNRENLVLVWETRGPAWETKEANKKLGQALERLTLIHVTDPLRITPAYTGRVAYFRLHGLGPKIYYYQHSDTELRKLEELVKPYEMEGKDVCILFNSLWMFGDGRRFMQYLLKRTFPRITSSIGLASTKEVVERTRYPVSKGMLTRRLGCRLVEVEEGKQIRLDTLLDKLSPRTYKDADELLYEVKVKR